jgi:radical SAM superfamily enzyme YgiQ (UPF0313 family)
VKILLAKSAHITSTDVSIIPPLGLLSVAAAVRRARPGRDDIRLIDLRVSSEAEYGRLLTEWQPDVVGISTLTAEAGHAHRISALAARLASNATVVWGGPHPTAYVDECLRDEHVDVLALHEGEEAFPEYLDAMERGEDPTAIAGLAFRRDGRLVRTAERPIIEDLDRLALPAWDMLDFGLYAGVKSMSLVGPRRVAPIMTSRACPYRCTYCHNMFGKKLQRRSADSVLAELTLLRRTYGVRHIEIIDDIFNADRRRSREILTRIAESGLDLRLSFPNGLRGDILQEEDFDLYRRAGTEFVSIAIESASPRIQAAIRKNIRLPKAAAAIRGFASRGIFTNCYYMLGFPGESRAEMQATVDFAIAQPSHTAMFFVVNPFKGTELGDAQGADLPAAFELHSYHDAAAGSLAEVGSDELAVIIRRAYLRFFADPRRLARLWRDHPQRGYLPSAVLLLIRRLLHGVWNEASLLQGWRRPPAVDAAGPAAEARPHPAT